MINTKTNCLLNYDRLNIGQSLLIATRLGTFLCGFSAPLPYNRDLVACKLVLTFDQVSGTGAHHQRLSVLASPRDLRLGVAGRVTRQGRVFALHQGQIGARLVRDDVWRHWKRYRPYCCITFLIILYDTDTETAEYLIIGIIGYTNMGTTLVFELVAARNRVQRYLGS